MVKTYMESSKQGLATSAVKSGKLGLRRDSNATYMLQRQGFTAEKCNTPKLSSQPANCAILASPKPQQMEHSAEIRNCRLVSGVPKMKCELQTPRMRRTRYRGRWNGWLQRPKKIQYNWEAGGRGSVGARARGWTRSERKLYGELRGNAFLIQRVRTCSNPSNCRIASFILPRVPISQGNMPAFSCLLCKSPF